MDLPFNCDYAGSNQSICRGCQDKIVKGTLRVAIVLPSNSFDGKVSNWYHFACFFVEHMPNSCREIEYSGFLKWEDKKKIEEIIAKGESPYASQETRAQLKRDISKANSAASVKDYTIDYTKVGIQKCAVCEDVIIKSEIRVTRKISSKKKKIYHLNCFIKVHEELDFLQCGNEMNGFYDLSVEDQELAKQKLPGLCEMPPKKKRPSTDEETEKPLSQEEMISKNYNDIMYDFRNNLKANLKKPELAKLLKANNQTVPIGIYKILDRASDMLTYGALASCMDCGRGQLEFSNIGYKCTNFKTEWKKCKHITVNPIRNDVVIPQNLKLKYDFLHKYEFVRRTQLIVQSTEKIISGPLEHKNIYLYGFSQAENTALCNNVKSLAGRVVSEVRRSVFCVITTEEKVEENTDVIKNAQEFQVYVVSKEFLEKISKNSLDEIALEHSLVSWGCELHLRVPEKFQRKNMMAYRRSGEEEKNGKRKMKVKSNSAVEPDSCLDHIAHVFKSGDLIFNAVLSNIDVTTNKNSFYKIQLLESDSLEDYWLYLGWGRIGTNNAGRSVNKMESLDMAKLKFQNTFREKTGNTWDNRSTMKKKPGKYMYIDVDYSADKEEIQNLNEQVADSSLKPAVAELIATIFNVEAMQNVMLEYELDIQKMPLGKLSRVQIKSAYAILNDISWALQRRDSQSDFEEYTNQFYSFMPCNSALGAPPLLNNKQIIEEKSDMLVNLMEMETAYSIIQREANGEGKNPLDAYYNQLKALIDPLEEYCEEFKLIEEYVHNTHADTHHNYDLKILEIFKVAREGEKERYAQFDNLHNRRLLWHGSRKTNYAGILSQGLRIAPPEALVTGYMFGKGIYFADMVSKSANYCCTSRDDSVGLVLLCEVALGNIDDKIRAEDVSHLPKNIHSVRGVGKTEPNPQNMKVLEDGLQIPLGEPVATAGQDKTNLLYNEYIVYDPSQVQIKYLLKLNFNFKY